MSATQPNLTTSNSPQILETHKKLKLIPSILSVPIFANYFFMNWLGSEILKFTSLRIFTGIASAIVNGMLYHLVFNNALNANSDGLRKKLPEFLNIFSKRKPESSLHEPLMPSNSPETVVNVESSGSNETADSNSQPQNQATNIENHKQPTLSPSWVAFWGILIGTICIMPAVPMLEATVAGMTLLNTALAGTPSMILGWYMTLSRALAVFQGVYNLPSTIKTIRTQLKEASKPTKYSILALSTLGSLVYVLSMRASVLSAMGNVNALGQDVACHFQKAPLSAQLLVQWFSTAINIPFYVLWISRGLLYVRDIFVNNAKYNKWDLFSIVALCALSMAPSAAPLFSDKKSSTPPLIKNGCQMTGAFHPAHTQFGFEQNKIFQLLVAVLDNMPLAACMNIASCFGFLGLSLGAVNSNTGSTTTSAIKTETGTNAVALLLVTDNHNEPYDDKSATNP